MSPSSTPCRAIAASPSLAIAPRVAYPSRMRADVLAAMTVFCFVAAVTPGPNNLMLMTSG